MTVVSPVVTYPRPGLPPLFWGREDRALRLGRVSRLAIHDPSRVRTYAVAARSRRRGLWVFAIALAPALVAIWATPWFVTQDGPAHLYNARSLRVHSTVEIPPQRRYRVRCGTAAQLGRPPVPGRLAPGHVASRCQSRDDHADPDRACGFDRLAALAGRGWRGMPLAALLAVLLAINLPWLLGFTSFMLGACLFPITLGIWWHGRERLWPGRVVLLGVVGLRVFQPPGQFRADGGGTHCARWLAPGSGDSPARVGRRSLCFPSPLWAGSTSA